MEKRGQVTMFLILGMVVVVLAMMMFYLSAFQAGNLKGEVKRSSSFDATLIQNYIADCAKETLIDAVSLHGLNETKLAEHINENLKNCTDFATFEGIEAAEGEVSSSVMLTADNKTLLANITYPVTLEKDQNIKTIKEYYTSYDLTTHINISVDNSSILLNDVFSYANNDDLNLTIPAGTKITNANGTPVDKIEIQIVHKSPENVGVVDYDFRPENVSFSPYAILVMKYRDEDNDGFVDDTDIDEKDMQIRYFDEPTSSWLSLPTDVDAVKNTLKAKIKKTATYGMGVPHKLILNVTNPIALERTNEPIKFTFLLNDSLLHINNADFVTVRENSTRKEILSDHLSYNIGKYPSGYVKSMTVVFMDDYNKSEIKHYKVSLNDISNFTEPDINVRFNDNPGFQHSYTQKEGYENTYTFDTSAIEIGNGKYNYILYYSGLRSEIIEVKYIVSQVQESNYSSGNAELQNYAIILTDGVCENVLTSPSDDLEKYWDIFRKCLEELDFSKECFEEDWWVDKQVTYAFEKPSIQYEKNKILSVIRLYYTQPRIIKFGSDAENHAGVTAYAEATFYRNSSRIDVFNSYSVVQKFYNHAGFDIGGTAVNVGGPFKFTFGDQWRDSDGFPFVFAYAPETTNSLFLKTDDADGEGIASKEYLSSAGFKNYYALDKGGGKVIFAYLPIFQSMFDMYEDEHGDHYPPSGFMSWGDVIAHTIVSTGMGVGWLPYPVPPREYSNVATYNTDMNFSTDLSMYDKQARIFANPVGVNGRFAAYTQVYAKK